MGDSFNVFFVFVPVILNLLFSYINVRIMRKYDRCFFAKFLLRERFL